MEHAVHPCVFYVRRMVMDFVVEDVALCLVRKEGVLSGVVVSQNIKPLVKSVQPLKQTMPADMVILVTSLWKQAIVAVLI